MWYVVEIIEIKLCLKEFYYIYSYFLNLYIQGNRAEFELLVTFLGLAQKGSSVVSKDSGLICTSCLKWFCDNHEMLVQGWCQHLVQALGQHPSSLRVQFIFPH